MKIHDAFTSVYSYTPPEIKRIISDVMANYPHDLVDGWAEQENYLLNFQKYPISALTTVRDKEVLGLDGFEHLYPTYGSDHAICEYMTHLQVNEKVTSIFMLEDDYEGYRERAKSRGLTPISLDINFDPKRIVPGHVWFLSNPSARDGNFLPEEFIQRLLDAGQRIVYDLAYLGTTDYHRFDLTHPGIDAALFSMSKPYGLFSHRIGFGFFRRPVPSLIANGLWFKNILGLRLAYSVLVTLNHVQYATKYKSQQFKIVEQLRKSANLPIQPSDSFLLAYITKEDAFFFPREVLQSIEKYRRGSGYRFCLTPFFGKENK